MRNTMKREYDFRNAKRGPAVSVRKGKTRITIRIDDDILAWFRDQVERAAGVYFQTLLNERDLHHFQPPQDPFLPPPPRALRAGPRCPPSFAPAPRGNPAQSNCPASPG